MTTSAPSLQEGYMHIVASLTTAIQGAIDVKHAVSSMPAQPHGGVDPFDEKKRCWTGDSGLTYRVPLVHSPSEIHARAKSRNVRVMMDNVRKIAVNDLLPATESEKQFWSNYRWLKYQLFLEPFCGLVPFFYFAHRYSRTKLPMLLRTRATPFAFAGIVAEQLMEANYPAQQLLGQTLQARTPLGDAARAEWSRLQAVTISPSNYMLYQWHELINDPMEGFNFGGDILSAMN